MRSRLGSLIAALLGLLALFLFVSVKAQSGQPTPTPILLLVAVSCLFLLSGRLWPSRETDIESESGDAGLLPDWVQGRIVLMFAGILFLLAYGLWAMFTGSL